MFRISYLDGCILRYPLTLYWFNLSSRSTSENVFIGFMDIIAINLVIIVLH